METNKIYQGDCLQLMKQVESNSVNLILCDLPYGVTARNEWDKIIPIDKLWEQYKRIIKDNGAIVLTATQPFASMLIMSNLKMFRYEWIWKKSQGTGHLNAKKQPLRNHEQVLIFYKNQPTYNPQIVGYEKRKVKRSGKQSKNTDYREFIEIAESDYEGRYPVTIQYFNRDKYKCHPTQKPVELFEYLIKTYSKEGDLVLDNCIGSGTTALACIRTNRSFIGMELSTEYVEIANERIQKELSLS
jgi:site-specific DNA-methyltransferase (adenine-specific)